MARLVRVGPYGALLLACIVQAAGACGTSSTGGAVATGGNAGTGTGGGSGAGGKAFGGSGGAFGGSGGAFGGDAGTGAGGGSGGTTGDASIGGSAGLWDATCAPSTGGSAGSVGSDAGLASTTAETIDAVCTAGAGLLCLTSAYGDCHQTLTAYYLDYAADGCGDVFESYLSCASQSSTLTCGYGFVTAPGCDTELDAWLNCTIGCSVGGNVDSNGYQHCSASCSNELGSVSYAADCIDSGGCMFCTCSGPKAGVQFTLPSGGGCVVDEDAVRSHCK